MNEGLNKTPEAGKMNDVEFEKAKRDIEWNNSKENDAHLVAKFSEKLVEAPIVVYTQHKEGKVQNKDLKTFNKVVRVFTNQAGTGYGVSVSFDKDNWIGVNFGSKDGKVDASFPFDKNNSFYKITEDSFQNILSIMSELIERSASPDVDKQKMFQLVVDNFRNKIIKDEDIPKIEK